MDATTSPDPLPDSFAGGCLCGAVRYECTRRPVLMFKCHCQDCQRATGSGYAAGLIVPTRAFRLTRGELRYHSTDSERGGRHRRGFCAECGSRITGAEMEERPRGIGVYAGSLDDPSWFRPTADIFVSEAQPWDLMDPERAKHDGHFPGI